jgi:hypothetical protein
MMACVQIRKVLFSFISVFFAPYGAQTQVYSGVLVLFIAATLESFWSPFTLPWMNTLSVVELVVAFLSLYCGVFLLDGVSSSSTREMATIVIVATNTVFVSFCVVALVRVTLASIQREQVQQLRRSASKLVRRASFMVSNPLRGSKRTMDVEAGSTRTMDLEAAEGGEGSQRGLARGNSMRSGILSNPLAMYVAKREAPGRGHAGVS